MKSVNTPEELLNFMSKNINYGYLGKNGKVYHYNDSDFNLDWFKQYILENSDDLLNNMCGNCWDQVEFEREWFTKNGYEFETIYKMVYLDYDNNYPTHSFLIYNDNGKWCWFENADFNNRGIHRFDTYNELINFQHKKYVDFLKTFNIREDEIKKILTTKFNKPNEHISAKKYLDHVINSDIIMFNKQ